jgi:electron transfer flavoprotein-quinone oxidoreductase
VRVRFNADLLYGVFRHDLTPRKHLLGVARDAMKKSPVKMHDLISDGWAGVRAL